MPSTMLFLAARDPARNVGIVDGLAIGLCVLAVTPIISLYRTDVRRPATVPLRSWISTAMIQATAAGKRNSRTGIL